MNGENIEQSSCSYAYNTTKFKCEHWKCLRTILVSGIPKTMLENDLIQRFSHYGCVDAVQFLHEGKLLGRYKKREALVIYCYAIDVVSVLKLRARAMKYSDRKYLFLNSYCYFNLSPAPALEPPLKKRKIKQSTVVGCAGETVVETTDYIKVLSDELMSRIFAYFLATERIGIERVCRRWRRINLEGPWIGMKVLRFPRQSEDHPKELRIEHLRAVLCRYGANLREIDFKHCLDEFSQNFPEEIANFCPNLESVNFSRMKILPEMMKLLAAKCPRITTLIFGRCNVRDVSIKCLLKRLQLKHLNLACNYNFLGNCLNILPESMDTLILDRCRNLEPCNIRLIAKCNNIRDLRLSYCRNISSDDLMFLLQAIGKNLAELHLGGRWCDRIMLSTALGYLRNLKGLSLRHNNNITNGDVILVSLMCPRLRFFDLTDVQVSNCVLNQLKDLTNLCVLRLNYNKKITDTGLIELSESTSLRRIYLRSCLSITNEGCRQLIHGCPNLMHLDIRAIKNIDDKIIDSMMHLPTTRKMPLTLVITGTSITNTCSFPRDISLKIIF